MSSEPSFDADSVFEENFGHKYHPDFFHAMESPVGSEDNGERLYTMADLKEHIRKAQERVYQSVMDTKYDSYRQSEACIDFFRSSSSNMKEINDRIRRELAILGESHHHLEIELLAHKKKISALEDRLIEQKRDFQNKNFGLRATLLCSRQQCAAKCDEIEKLKQANDNLNDQNAAQAQRLIEYRRDFSDLEMAIDDMSQQVINIAGALVPVQGAHVTLADITSEYLYRHLVARSWHTEGYKRRMAKIRWGQERIVQLEAQDQARAAELARLEAQDQARAAELARLEDALRDRDAAIRALEEQCARRSAGLGEQEARAWESRIQTLEAELERRDSAALDLRFQVTALHEQCESMAQEIAGLRDRCQTLATQAERGRADALCLQAQLDSQTARADRAERINEGNLRGFEQEREQFRGAKMHLEERNKQLKSQIRDIRSAVKQDCEKTLKELMSGLNCRSVELLGQFTALKEEQGKLAMKLKGFFVLQKEYEQTCRQLSETQRMLADIQMQCCELKDTKNVCTPQTVAELHAGSLLIANLSEKLRNSAEQNQRLLEQNMEMDKEIRELRISNRSAHEMFMNMDPKVKENMYKVTVLEGKLKEAYTENEKLEFVVDKLKEKVLQLRAQMGGAAGTSARK